MRFRSFSRAVLIAAAVLLLTGCVYMTGQDQRDIVQNIVEILFWWLY